MKSYILVADVIGFSRLVTNLDHNQLDERLSSWVSLVEEIRIESGVQHSQLISDTLFVREDDSAKGFHRLLRYSKILLERGLASHFPIRGAITNGDLTWGKLTYGKALIRSHELERQQDWIGIACESLMADIPWSWDLVCCYPVPKKTGLIQLSPAVVWNIPKRSDLIRLCSAEGLMKPGDHFVWQIHSKLANTLAFSKYVRNAKEQKSDPAKYRTEFSVGPI